MKPLYATPILVTLLGVLLVVGVRKVLDDPLTPSALPAYPQKDRKDQKDLEELVYGMESYDKVREVTYWGSAALTLSSYAGADDTVALGLNGTAKGISGRTHADRIHANQDIQEHFMSEFKKYFGDLPFHDLDKGKYEREMKFKEQYKGEQKDFYPSFRAAEEARRRSLYGGRAGAISCDVLVKRRDFPILYQIRCHLSANNDLQGPSGVNVADMGFSTREHIAGEIKLVLSQMLQGINNTMATIRKYGKAKKVEPIRKDKDNERQ